MAIRYTDLPDRRRDRGLIERRWKAREYQTEGGTAISRLVFHRDGERMGDWRKSWTAACVAAGFTKPKVRRDGTPVLDRQGRPAVTSSLRFHDLRRSAVSNATNAGVDQKTAMQLSGHETISVFLRYRITDDDNVREALAKIEAAGRAQKSNVVPLRAKEAYNPTVGTITGTIKAPETIRGLFTSATYWI